MWPWAKMKEAGIEVFDGPHATPPKAESGPVFLGISNLINGRLNTTDVEYIQEEYFPKWTRRVTPEAGDIVFSYETRLGEAAMIPEGLRCCLGRRMGLLRCDRSIVEPRFLLYLYLSPGFQEFLESRTLHGSTVNRLPVGDFPEFEIPVPPLSEQRAIASVLGALDDKIELNRQMNRTLEEMAAALFKSWFVDFDPVHAKAEGRRPFGMDDETAALFPERFVETEEGLVPEGWNYQQLGEVTSYLKRGIGPKYIDDGGVRVVNQRCIRDSRVSLRDARHHDPAQKKFDGRFLVPDDVLINSTGVGTLGRAAQLPDFGETLIADSHVTVVRADGDAVLQQYLAAALLSRQDELADMGEGSTEPPRVLRRLG